MKKIIAAVSTLFIAIALSLVAVAAPASAHTATLTGSVACNTSDGSATVTWTVVNDYNELLNITASNNAAIPVGTTVAATGGGANTSKTFTQILPAPSNGHSATATLSFLWSGDNYTQKDTKFTTDKVTDCDVPPTKDASAAIVDTAATCTSAEAVSEGAVTNATWTHTHVTSSTYSFTATANSGHVFSNGETTESFSGNISGELGGPTCDNTSTKVPLCHATGSNSNPYTSLSVSYSSILGGTNPGDIIPPFSYIKNGVNGSYPGQNWDAAHQAIYNNGCKVPPPPVCIPNSSVSFHYSQNDANNGYITVTDVANSTGQLCNPFWVTATSWTFTNNSSVWPQNRDVVDKLGEISAPGTYDFAAKVTCGQGDIYASFDSTAPSLNPGPQLFGPSNPFVEHFLSDMGFSGSATPTYTQDTANCFVPTPETGTPVSTVLTCTAGSSNALTLPAVPGGVWTVTSAHYSNTYAIGTGETSFTPTYFEKYTIVLTDGSSADGYLVTGDTNYWTPVNPGTLDCNTIVTPATPTATAIDQCGVLGSVTIPNTTGVVYSHNGHVVSGTVTGLYDGYTVTAAAAPGYEFAPDTTDQWTFQLGDRLSCDVHQVLGSCTVGDSGSTKSVSLKLDNTASSVSSTFEVKVEGTSYDQTFTVDANSTSTVLINQATTAGENIDVFINGSRHATQVCIPPFNGCVPATPADPTFTALTCTGSTTNGGSISTDGNADLIYTLTGNLAAGGTYGPVVIPSLPATPTITGLAAGDYTVNVTAQPGFVLSGATAFPVDIPLAAPDCIGTQLTPVVSSVAPSCAPNPVNLTSSQFNAALAEVQGTITIPSDANMTFTINNGSTTVPITPGTYIEPDGTYTVVATLTSTAIADGFTFGPSAGYTLSAGDTVATFTPIGFTANCLPTLASWHSGATGTPAVCTLTGGQDGTITLVHGSSTTDLTDEAGKVTYTLVNLGNNATTNLGSTALTVHVAPGSYKIEATPTDPADGLVGNPNPTNVINYFVTIAAATAVCDGNLAFTGGTIGWFGFALAGGMLFLGIAFLYMKRRGNRATE
jgi:hypothetical protein